MATFPPSLSREERAISKYSGILDRMRFYGKMLGRSAGFSPQILDLHEDVQVFHSKAISRRFAGDSSGSSLPLATIATPSGDPGSPNGSQREVGHFRKVEQRVIRF